MPRLVTVIAVTLLAAATPAAAQIAGKSLAKGVDAATMKAVGPAVQKVLADGRAGATEPWSTDTARGNVRVIGSDPKQPACRRVRMNSVADGVEKRGYVFRYCPDTAGRWRIAG